MRLDTSRRTSSNPIVVKMYSGVIDVLPGVKAADSLGPGNLAVTRVG